MPARIPQRLQHHDVFAFASRLLEDLAARADDDGVRCQDQPGPPFFFIVDFPAVDVEGFLRGGLDGVFERGERFGQVFGEVGGDGFEGGKAEEGEDLVPSRGGGGEDEAFGAEGGEEGEL